MKKLAAEFRAGGVPEWAEPLRNCLFIQCDDQQALAAAKLANRPLSGLIVTASRSRVANALSAAEYLRARGYAQPMLVDAGRYAGQNRVAASNPFDPTFMSRQRALGLPVLTDAGYVRERDFDGLRSVVARARDNDAIAMLAVHPSFLINAAARAALIGAVSGAGVVAALAIEHQGDPFETSAAVTGLVEILESTNTMLIRSDTSALGALCFGALGGAIGTRTGLRHIFPQKDDSGPRNPATAAAIGKGLTYTTLQKIFFAQQADSDNDMWICWCNTCRGNSVGALFTIPDPTLQEVRAFEHSLETILDLRDNLCSSAMSVAERQESWIAQVHSAQFFHLAVNSEAHQWKPPKFLGAWLKATAGRPDLHERVR